MPVHQWNSVGVIISQCLCLCVLPSYDDQLLSRLIKEHILAFPWINDHREAERKRRGKSEANERVKRERHTSKMIWTEIEKRIKIWVYAQLDDLESGEVKMAGRIMKELRKRGGRGEEAVQRAVSHHCDLEWELVPSHISVNSPSILLPFPFSRCLPLHLPCICHLHSIKYIFDLI